MPSDAYTLPPKKRPVRKLLCAVIGIAWTLVAAELFLRVFAQQPLMPRNVTGSEFGIRVNEPNTTYWQRTPEVNVRVHINSQGIRADEDISLEKPPGVKRIVVLGDSYGMGYEVDLKDSFTTQMANILNASGEHVQIVNLSVSGYGNSEELLMLENRGFAFHPDLVLLAWHHTDLDDNIRSQLYALRNGKLVRDQATYLPGVKARQMLGHIPGYDWVEANSQLYSFIREKASTKVKALLVATHGGEEPPPADTPATTPATLPAAEPTYEQRLVAALLKQIEIESHEHGAKLLILDVPARTSRTHFFSLFPQAAASEAGGFDVVSPLEIFAQHKGDKLFWEQGHYHFTIEGCQLVGQLLAHHVMQRHLLDSSAPPAQR